MEQSPAKEANCPHLIKYLALYRTCHVNKTPPLIPILSQINTVHAVVSCCFKVHSLIVATVELRF
jgi:hypothetical protein